MTTFDPNKLVAPTPAPAPITGQASASSRGAGGGIGGFGTMLDFQMNPQQRQEMERLRSAADIGNLTYSAPAGGYVPTSQAQNANSYYNKFGGYDPEATRKAEQFYNFLGTLPERTIGGFSPALAALGGGSSKPYGPPLGTKEDPWMGPYGINPVNRFTSTPIPYSAGGGGPFG